MLFVNQILECHHELFEAYHHLHLINTKNECIKNFSYKNLKQLWFKNIYISISRIISKVLLPQKISSTIFYLALYIYTHTNAKKWKIFMFFSECDFLY